MSRRPLPLKQILEAWIKRSGLSGGLAEGRLSEEWENLVGTRISGVSRPIRVRGETLLVEVEDPVWRNELSLLQGHILTEISKMDGLPRVRSIRFLGRRGGGDRQ